MRNPAAVVLAAVAVALLAFGVVFAFTRSASPTVLPERCRALDEQVDAAVLRLAELTETDEVGTPEGQRLVDDLADWNRESVRAGCYS